jgi:hypothetical protein
MQIRGQIQHPIHTIVGTKVSTDMIDTASTSTASSMAPTASELPLWCPCRHCLLRDWQAGSETPATSATDDPATTTLFNDGLEVNG